MSDQPAAAAASPEPSQSPAKQRSPSKRPDAHQRLKELEMQYRATRKDWKNASPAFAAKTDRFAKTRAPATEAMYTVANDTVGHKAFDRSAKHSPWSQTKGPQRPPVPEPACKAVYNPQDPGEKRNTAKAAFSSNAPQRPESAKLHPGQAGLGLDLRPAADEREKGKGSSVMRSRSPRFHDPVVWTTGAPIAPPQGTIAATLAANKSKGNSAFLSRTVQRPEPRKGVDAAYDVHKTPEDKHNHAAAAFKGLTPRFEDPKPKAPPVGLYTSPFISVGMMTN